MSSPNVHSAPKVEQGGDVRVITFTSDKVRDVENMIARELQARTEGLAGAHLLLDFTNVDYLSSVELGTLITLHKRMRASGGRLTLFNLTDRIYEIFTTTRLDTLLRICREGACSGGSGDTNAVQDGADTAGMTGSCHPADPDKFVHCG